MLDFLAGSAGDEWMADRFGDHERGYQTLVGRHHRHRGAGTTTHQQGHVGSPKPRACGSYSDTWGTSRVSAETFMDDGDIWVAEGLRDNPPLGFNRFCPRVE